MDQILNDVLPEAHYLAQLLNSNNGNTNTIDEEYYIGEVTDDDNESMYNNSVLQNNNTNMYDEEYEY